MSEVPFTQFLKQYGLHELSPTPEPVQPGTLVSKRFLRRAVDHCGHLAEIFTSMPKWFWDTDVDRANLVNGAVRHTVWVPESGQFSTLGLQAAEPLPAGSEVKITITEVVGSSFRIGPGRANKFSLLALLNNLRATQRERWKQLEERWVVLEVFYAAAAVFDFDHEAQEHEWRTASGGEVTLEWDSPNRLIFRNRQLPFAFCGFKV